MTVRRIIVLAMATALMAASLGSAGQSKGGKTPPPPAVTADFRSDSGDKVTDDGAAYPPNNGTEGAFINSSGGLTIALQPGGLDRTMLFDFSAPTTDWGTCNRGFWLGAHVTAAQVTLGLNAINSAGANVGLQSLTSVGASARGTGTINFYSGISGDPYFWTLRFNKNVKVTRTAAVPATWTIEWDQQPGGYATLQCTTIKRPTVIADDSVWVMPFKITVTAQ